ncbi:hypothetical protein [Bacillus norwichensis]|uniref:DUF2651 domain-containing protein n=1 Tax=Bacillus norwichensis TaxID=2762217 RepID=A0ABR8VIZ1_9BACI|nr:hypothetical protein [Bacillus norwichensis]MBD8004740.1 hypothetical protein [Bacillus norwichensis]
MSALVDLRILILIVLTILFSLTLIFDKKRMALSISVFLLLLGLWMFVAGFAIVMGWEGMGITITGLIYFATGLIFILLFSLKMYLNSIKIG